MKPPKSVQLPGGRVVALRPKRAIGPREPNAPDFLFAGARELFERDVALEHDGATVAVGSLTLAEFHALRAIATHVGWLREDEVEIACRNCDETLRVKPCASLPLGPFADAELDDEELDALLELDVPHDVPELGKPVRLVQRTLAEAEPLHRALAASELRITSAVVRAMGVAAVGKTTDPRAIARILSRCDDRAFGAVTNLFLDAHYSPRLFGLAICPHCGTRNDLDAPYDRELEPFEEERARGNETLPSFEEFDALARRIAEPLLARASGRALHFVVEGGIPACDDGGEPLLGSYVPGHDGDARTPANPGEITVFYRTFAAMWNEDGPYDVEAELRETVVHELEHHEATVRGHDPKDEEERDEIARETRRVLGEKAVVRSAARGFVHEVGDFWKRTWPVWVLALIAAVIVALASK